MFNLMTEDAFKEISNIIRKVRCLILWNYSPRWDYTAFKLKQALDLELMGEFSSQHVRDNYDIPSTDEWRKVKCVYKLVEIAHDVANFASNVAKKMLQRIDKYLNDMFLVLAIASVMDPRCKMRYIEYLSSKSMLYGDYVNNDLEKEHSMSDSTSDDSEEELPNIRRPIGMGLFHSHTCRICTPFLSLLGPGEDGTEGNIAHLRWLSKRHSGQSYENPPLSASEWKWQLYVLGNEYSSEDGSRKGRQWKVVASIVLDLVLRTSSSLIGMHLSSSAMNSAKVLFPVQG
ncbi:hypothetical protein HYC85_019095 [Camellia sinensis]|uniref:hAT-like transposase RNase-H fold domain-containing protein n=1 Tax=Camellia sinensis TaxID=4442 RepID=A0A7J7GKX0_CAMSI|nr:hypothetical protein HYC85_019095 [Camellia sinensis]